MATNAANTSSLHHDGEGNSPARAIDFDDAAQPSPVSVPTAKVIPIHRRAGTGTTLDRTELPLSPEEPEKTDITDETDLSSISNADFLASIFGSLKGDDRPVVCGISGNPRTAPGSSWMGQPWVPGTIVTEEPGQNRYFSLATFNRDAHGKYKRQKKQFAGLTAIMLDDIGTKAPDRSRLDALPPTWLIETSPGNFQAGYAFSEPVTDLCVADALMNGVILAGLCDKGANGPWTRYARLPVAVNGKHTPAFACRLVEWHPELRYSPEEIVAGLKLDLAKPAETRSKSPSRSGGTPSGSVIYMPRPAENPIVTILKDRGLHKDSDGWASMT